MDLDSDCVSQVASRVHWIVEIHIIIQVDVKFDGFRLAIIPYRVTRLCRRFCGLALSALYTRNLVATANSLSAVFPIFTTHVLYTFLIPDLPSVILSSFSVVTPTRYL